MKLLTDSDYPIPPCDVSSSVKKRRSEQASPSVFL